MFSVKIARWSVLVLCLTLLTHCAALRPVEDTLTRHKALLQIAVALGVGRFLAEQPQHAKLVYNVAHSARAILKDGTVDVTQIVPLVLEKLHASIRDPEVRLLLDTLLQAVAQEVQTYIKEAGIPPGTVPVLVSEVMKWIEQAASVRLGGA